MQITIFTNDGNHDDHSLAQDAVSKSDALESITERYTDDTLERIEVRYDAIETATVDGKRSTEPGGLVIVHTLDALKTELGKFTG